MEINTISLLNKHVDELAYMSDEELAKFYNTLCSKHDYISKYSQKQSCLTTLKLEEELCYVQRELLIRQERRTAHAKYMQNESTFETSVSGEEFLPDGNFDNAAYIKIWHEVKHIQNSH